MIEHSNRHEGSSSGEENDRQRQVRVDEAAARRGEGEREAEVLVRYADVSDLPHLIGALTASESGYAAAVIALVRLSGTGVDAMPVGAGTLAQRGAAQQWWMDWFRRVRATFSPAPKEVADRAVSAMYDKLRRRESLARSRSGATENH